MKALVLLLILACGSLASATVYTCNLPMDSTGHAVYGGPVYRVNITAQSVILREIIGFSAKHSAGHSFKMAKKHQLSNGAVYEAAGVTATVTDAVVSGKPETSVALEIKYGADTFVANCY